MATCENCGGTGSITISATCQRCSGTAEIIIYDSDGNEGLEVCSNCEDGLIYIEQTCHICKGKGVIQAE